MGSLKDTLGYFGWYLIRFIFNISIISAFHSYTVLSVHTRVLQSVNTSGKLQFPAGAAIFPAWRHGARMKTVHDTVYFKDRQRLQYWQIYSSSLCVAKESTASLVRTAQWRSQSGVCLSSCWISPLFPSPCCSFPRQTPEMFLPESIGSPLSSSWCQLRSQMPYQILSS